MATANHVCTLCQEDGVSHAAISWCSDCETFLCANCSTCHGRIKSSKMHEVVTVDEVKKLPAFVLETSNQCDAHERMNEFYCQVHQVACCVNCIKSNHKDCRELVPLSDIIKDIKSSAAVSHLESDVKRLKKNYELAIAAILENIKHLKGEKYKCTTEIQQAREKINSHLDELEQKFQEELSSQCLKLETSMQRLQEEITTKLANIQQVEQDFGNIKTYGTNLQAFSALKSYELLSEVDFKFLLETQVQNKLGKISLKIDTSPILNIFEMKLFGTRTLTEATDSVIFDTEQVVQVPKFDISIDDIHVRLLNDLSVQSEQEVRIRNCLICPNGEKVLVDQYNNMLVRFSDDNAFINDISLENKPCDICHVELNLIAVTFYNEKLISIIEVKSQKIKETFTVPYQCYGIDSDSQHLFVSFANEGKLGILNFSGIVLSTFNLHSKNIKEIALSGDRIYGSDSELHTVSCYSTTGHLLWTYMHDDILTPRGLSTDKNSLVYVACSGSKKTVVISPNGERCRVILTAKNGIEKPYALHVNKELSLLLIGDWLNGRASLYQL